MIIIQNDTQYQKHDNKHKRGRAMWAGNHLGAHNLKKYIQIMNNQIMKKLCALLCIKFFFQQDDTKIVNFDEGVLILEPISWGNVIFKIWNFCIKSHVWGREEFLWVAPPDSNAASRQSYVMNASLYSCWLRFLNTKQEHIHFTRGSQRMENFGM